MLLLYRFKAVFSGETGFASFPRVLFLQMFLNKTRGDWNVFLSGRISFVHQTISIKAGKHKSLTLKVTWPHHFYTLHDSWPNYIVASVDYQLADKRNFTGKNVSPPENVSRYKSSVGRNLTGTNPPGRLFKAERNYTGTPAVRRQYANKMIITLVRVNAKRWSWPRLLMVQAACWNSTTLTNPHLAKWLPDSNGREPPTSPVHCDDCVTSFSHVPEPLDWVMYAFSSNQPDSVAEQSMSTSHSQWSSPYL